MIVDLDQEGVDFIEKREKFIPYIYDDRDPNKVKKSLKSFKEAVGYPTIGIGMKIHTEEDFAYWLEQVPLTYERAKELYIEKLKPYVRAVAKTPFIFKQNQFNAMVSFCYNIGPTGYKNSDVYEALCCGDTARAMDVLITYVHSQGIYSPGLKARRQEERNVFIGGVGRSKAAPISSAS